MCVNLFDSIELRVRKTVCIKIAVIPHTRSMYVVLLQLLHPLYRSHNKLVEQMTLDMIS